MRKEKEHKITQNEIAFQQCLGIMRAELVKHLFQCDILYIMVNTRMSVLAFMGRIEQMMLIAYKAKD
jgi:hypothetical protein